MATENTPRDPEQQVEPGSEDQRETMEEDFVDDDLEGVSEADDRINSAEGPV